MKVSLIVAMDLERGIGRNNDLMWHLPADMKFFRETTTNHVVVMGRKNYDSIPTKFRPLPNRENVVLTRNENYKAEGCLVFNSLEACLEHYKTETDKTIFIIGGGEIYRNALGLNCVDEMYISRVNKIYGADTFFPEFNLKDWKVQTIHSHEKDAQNEASFTVVKYKK